MSTPSIADGTNLGKVSEQRLIEDEMAAMANAPSKASNQTVDAAAVDNVASQESKDKKAKKDAKAKESAQSDDQTPVEDKKSTASVMPDEEAEPKKEEEKSS